MRDKSLLQAKTLEFCSDQQRQLFNEIVESGTLTFVSGPIGIGVHLVGIFYIRKQMLYGPEDRLDLADGSTHVHIDWLRVKRCKVSQWENEGEIAFYDDQELLFKIFRLDGPFSESIVRYSGIDLLSTEGEL